MADDETAILERLRRVVRDHPQARLARATGRPRTALTRYMQGGKVPMEFACAMCREIGVNADWLINGRGPMYVSDQPAATTSLGRDLLELIRTMDAVANVRVGLLAGRAQAAALREVADSLARYGSLRERLHARTKPVFEEVLDQLQQALDRKQFDRASALEGTAASLERFTDDLALSRRLAHAQTHILIVRRQHERATEIELRMFQAMLGEGGDYAELAKAAHSLALGLRSTFLTRRARKVLRLAVASADQDDTRRPMFEILLSQLIMTGVEAGDLDGTHELLARAMASSRSGHRPHVDVARLYLHLFTGELPVGDVAGATFSDFPAAGLVLMIAGLTEEPGLIERALASVRAVVNAQMPLHGARLQEGNELLAALHGKVAGDWKRGLRSKAREAAKRWQDLEELTRLTQLLRLTGDKSAPQFCVASQELLDAVPAGFNATPVAVTRHICNVLRGIPADARDAELRGLRNRAEALRDERVASGFGLLRELGV